MVAFHITVLYDIYSHTRRWQSRVADGGRTSIYWSDGSDVWSTDAFTYRLKSANFL